MKRILPMLRFAGLLLAAATVACVCLRPLWNARLARRSGQDAAYILRVAGQEGDALVRGRYLHFVMQTRVKGDFTRGGHGFVTLRTRSNGEAFLDKVFPAPPEKEPYFGVVWRSRWWNDAITAPFDRVALSHVPSKAEREFLAAAAKRHQLRLKVRISGGHIALESLCIGFVPVEEALAEIRAGRLE